MSKQNKSNLNVTPTGDVITDYFDWMQDPKEQPRKEKLNYLAALISHFRQIEFLERYKSAGYENTNEAVYWLLGQKRYQDNIVGYRFEVQKLLRLLATPQVMAAVKAVCPAFDGDTAEMLDNLLDFFITLNDPVYLTMLQLHNMLQNPPEDESEIEQLTIEYEERIRSAATGKIKNYY